MRCHLGTASCGWKFTELVSGHKCHVSGMTKFLFSPFWAQELVAFCFTDEETKPGSPRAAVGTGETRLVPRKIPQGSFKAVNGPWRQTSVPRRL